ncbi:hypothetical protein AAE478_009312 [Parahypoxylon ruwenzoriense]
MLRQNIAILEEKRANSEPHPPGSAPYVSSSMYKTREPNSTLKAKSWDHRFSLESRGSHAATLRASARASNNLNMINLGTGRPSSEHYPWESMAMGGVDSDPGSGDEPFRSAVSMSCEKGEKAYDLSVALNYGYSAGSPQVLRFVTEHVELIHNPPYEDWASCLTCGTTSAIDIALRIFCNRGDWIITESYTYSETINCAKLHGLNILSIAMDEDGLSPVDLDQKLRNWDAARGPKPFVLYTIPSGHNPTGITQSLKRRKVIYQVAEEHDLYIIEDDPYYFLQLGDYGSTAKEITTSPADEYLNGLLPSYLSLDVSGRVLRMDSTSKILAPGLRCGWMTGSSQVIQKFIAQSEVSTFAPSGPSQIMLYKLLDGCWGHQGFIDWLRNLSSQYRRRRDILDEACNRHLPSGICHWTIPVVGMFLWIRLDLTRHPSLQRNKSQQEAWQSRLDTEDRIYAEAKANGVLVSKGSWFVTGNEQPLDVCFRLTFAAAARNDIDRAVERFATALRTEYSGAL